MFDEANAVITVARAIQAAAHRICAGALDVEVAVLETEPQRCVDGLNTIEAALASLNETMQELRDGMGGESPPEEGS